MKATHGTFSGNMPGGFGNFTVTVFAGKKVVAHACFKAKGYGSKHVDDAYAAAKKFAASHGVS